MARWADNVRDLLPTHPHDNGMGRNVPPVDTLRQSPRRIEFGKPSCFTLPKNGEFDRDLQSNGTKQGSPVHDQSLIYQELGGHFAFGSSNLGNNESSATPSETRCGNLEDD